MYLISIKARAPKLKCFQSYNTYYLLGFTRNLIPNNIHGPKCSSITLAIHQNKPACCSMGYQWPDGTPEAQKISCGYEHYTSYAYYSRHILPWLQQEHNLHIQTGTYFSYSAIVWTQRTSNTCSVYIIFLYKRALRMKD